MTRPERIHCRQAVDQLYDFLDAELTPEAEAAVRQHLSECAGCLGLFDFEAAYLRFLEARTRTVGTPPRLRRRILHELFGTGGTAAE